MLLIDWLTLRIKLDEIHAPALLERIRSCLGLIQCWSPDGELTWQKHSLDIDRLRSDTVGLVWQVQGDGKDQYLAIAGSPASIRNNGINVFGDLNISDGAQTLIRLARKALNCILPGIEHWQCRRIDITGNYLLPDPESVKQALQMLMVSDGGRRKAGSAKNGGDTVTWNPTSDLAKGKAYHKGPQLEHLCKKRHLEISADYLSAAYRLLRLEHTRGARWFRRLEESGKNWLDLTPEDLEELYRDFFGKLVNGVEVKDMDRDDTIKLIQDANCITHGKASAAFTTMLNIRQFGFEVVKGYMPHSTFCRHLKHLRAAGITDADMRTAKVIPIRPVKIVLAEPVSSWEQILKAA